MSSNVLIFLCIALFDYFQEFSSNLFDLFDLSGSGSLTNGEWLDLIRANIRYYVNFSIVDHYGYYQYCFTSLECLFDCGNSQTYVIWKS